MDTRVNARNPSAVTINHTQLSTPQFLFPSFSAKHPAIKAACIALLSLVATFSLAADPPIKVLFTGMPGAYTVAQWKRDWPGCEFEGGVSDGRVFLTEKDNHKWLQVHFAPGEIGPEKGGAGWRFPIGSQDSAELAYAMRLSPDFDFVKGGKLPGLCGGPDNVSGGRRATGTNGFSARLMWRKDGKGEAYVYHKNQPDDYGESFPFPEYFRFPTDTIISVRLRVTMNEVGKRNGTLRVWITEDGKQERLMVERADMEWRTVSTFAIDGLYFETFHGGGDSSWAPTRECWAEFANFEVNAPKPVSP